MGWILPCDLLASPAVIHVSEGSTVCCCYCHKEGMVKACCYSFLIMASKATDSCKALSSALSYSGDRPKVTRLHRGGVERQHQWWREAE